MSAEICTPHDAVMVYASYERLLAEYADMEAAHQRAGSWDIAAGIREEIKRHKAIQGHYGRIITSGQPGVFL